MVEPVVLLGRGGSGTRLMSQLVQHIGVFLGSDINPTGDSVELVDAIYGGAIATAERGELSAMPDVRDAIERLAANRPDPDGRWGWKLPETAVIADGIVRAFPQAQFIHMVRHPVSSAIRRHHMTSNIKTPVGQSVLRAAYAEAGRDPAHIETDAVYLRNAYTWRYQIGRVVNALKGVADNQTLQIKYEHLLTQPLEVQRQVERFIGLDAAAPCPLEIDPARAGQFEPDDARIAEVWAICRDRAEAIGYHAPSDYQLQS
jgi:hypothetical protein